MMREPAGNSIFATDAGHQRLMIIDAIGETVSYLSLPGVPGELAISVDHHTLAVSLGTQGIALISLDSMTVTDTLSPGHEVVSVAFDQQQNIFYSTTDYWGKIHHLDTQTGVEINEFGLGSTLAYSVYKGALLRTDSGGNTLYVAERGLSPASLTKIDVQFEPVFVAEDHHGDMGSNLRDVSVSPDGTRIYVAAGAPYSIQVIDAETLLPVGSLSTGAYPAAVDVSETGAFILGSPSSPYNSDVYVFDAATSQTLQVYDLMARSTLPNSRVMIRGMAATRDGAKAFVVFGDDYPSNPAMEIQVVDTGVEEEVNDPPVIDLSPLAYTVAENSALSVDINAADANGDPLFFSSANLPPGASLSPSGAESAMFSWTPTFSQAGVYQPVFEVSDGALTDSVQVEITVLNTNQAPSLSVPQSSYEIKARNPLSLTVQADDPDGDSLTLLALNLPAGAEWLQTGNSATFRGRRRKNKWALIRWLSPQVMVI
jgi:DNA-binding beta-propeller fold protein YncE